MLFQEQPGKKWRKHDFLLIEALEIMESERCGQCGLPRWQCHDETGDIQFRITEDVCVVKRDIDIKNEESSKAEAKNHGVSLLPEPFYVNGGDPVTLRDAYYEAVKKRQEEREKELSALEEDDEED